MDAKPLVSICCITYNHELFIRQCLDGFMAQETDFPFEILIHDDASTDRTQDIIKEYQTKYPEIIKPFLQTDNQYSKGVRGMNFRFNFPRANGKYIAICEGDDYWSESRKLQKQVDFLESNPDVIFCSHYVNRVDAEGNFLKQPLVPNELIYCQKEDIFHYVFPTLSLLFRKVELKYTEQLLKVFNGDAVLVGLLSSYGNAAHLNFVGASYRIHANGVYRQSPFLENQKKSIETRRAMIKSSSFDEWQKKEIRKNISLRKRSGIKYALKKLDFLQAIEIATL